VISGLVSGIGIWISARVARVIHAEKLAFDREQAERRADAEVALAERKFQYDRDLDAWKRRTNLAEEVLADFYRARDFIRDARWPHRVVAPGYEEGSSRLKSDNETEDVRQYRNMIFARVERLGRHSDFFNVLYAKRYQFAALFGKNSETIFRDLENKRIEIAIIANVLMEEYHGASMENEHQSEIRRNQERTLFASAQSEDDFQKTIDDIVFAMEKICKPEIQGRAPYDPT
jgi:hypothetical protein